MRKILRMKMRGRSQHTHYLSAGKVPVFAQFTVKCFEEHFVGDLADVHAGVIEDCNDPFVLLLHKVHDDLIVEVINLRDTAKEQFQREQRLGWVRQWRLHMYLPSSFRLSVPQSVCH